MLQAKVVNQRGKGKEAPRLPALGQASTAVEPPIGRAFSLGGTRIAQGDWIVADEDGVVVVPAAAWTDVAAKITKNAVREIRIRCGIEAGAAFWTCSRG